MLETLGSDKVIPVLEMLGKLLGIGFGSAIAVVVAIFLVRASVAKAVEIAGQRELERLKADLSKDLEAKRQDFARELERDRVSAARDLEQFKAQLNLDAEVRRQVAAKKVAALLEIVSLGEPLLRSVLNAPPGDRTAQAKAFVDVNGYVLKARDLAFFFDDPTYRSLQGYAKKMFEAGQRWQAGEAEGYRLATSAYEEMLALVRRELGVASPASPHQESQVVPTLPADHSPTSG